jgi:hypothetical protein
MDHFPCAGMSLSPTFLPWSIRDEGWMFPGARAARLVLIEGAVEDGRSTAWVVGEWR